MRVVSLALLILCCGAGLLLGSSTPALSQERELTEGSPASQVSEIGVAIQKVVPEEPVRPSRLRQPVRLA